MISFQHLATTAAPAKVLGDSAFFPSSVTLLELAARQSSLPFLSSTCLINFVSLPDRTELAKRRRAARSFLLFSFFVIFFQADSAKTVNDQMLKIVF